MCPTTLPADWSKQAAVSKASEAAGCRHRLGLRGQIGTGSDRPPRATTVGRVGVDTDQYLLNKKLHGNNLAQDTMI